MAVPAGGEAPLLPSSWFGTVEVSGSPATDGSAISAWFGGAEIAVGETAAEAGEARYQLDVPGDRLETVPVEGPREGDSFEIRVAGRAAGTLIWSEGSYGRRDLSVTAGADLRVSVSDGVATVAAGAEVTVTLILTNDGPGAATGTIVELTLPTGTSAPTISDGGAASAGIVRWPALDLAEGASVTRSLRLRLGESFAAGVATIAVEGRANHDGANGPDPDPGDNLATDVDQLEAQPELGVALSDGHSSARPGDTLFYRLLVSNQGSQGATGVSASVVLPVGVEYYSASHGGSLSGGKVSWPVFAAPVASQEERTVTVRVPATLSAAVTSLSASASVRDDGANGADPLASNDSAVDSDLVERLPDLQVDGVDPSGAISDLQTLALAGQVTVAIANRGSAPAAPFEVVLFLDRDGDATFDTGEPELGRQPAAGLAAAGVASAIVPVSGALQFRDERIFAFVDAGRVVPESDETNNVGDSAKRCGAGGPAGSFQPVVEMHWPPAGGPGRFPRAIDSLSTPIVVQLTDDNGDGRWDEHDVPDIVFVAADLVYTLEPQVALRAIRGDSGESLFDVNGLFPGPLGSSMLFSLSGLAAGDIDNDGKPEIVTTLYGGGNVVRAYEHNGLFKWQSPSYRTHPVAGTTTSRDNPTIADLDGDGQVEIVVGANVFDRTGKLKWRGTGGQAFQAANNLGDFRSGAISVAADVDLDGRLEVVTGNTLYRHDGSIVWQVPFPDGYPAVANFDADPNPEIVVVAQGTVRLHDANGALIWGPNALPGSDPEAGGPPTVGDFDGDGAPEIGVAGSDVYVVYETNGAIRWQASTRDYTSNTTGSTLFDFDGDGRVEVVYRDEQKLRIYRGTDGVVLFEQAMSSDTWTEEPIVADVDGDGHAEIVVSSDRAVDVPASGTRTSGIFVLGDPLDRWVAARPIWNQHAYTPELVGDSGEVPRVPAWSWLTHNSFRANVAPAGGAFVSPDLTAARISVDLSHPSRIRVGARIGNAGLTTVAPGASVAFYAGSPGSGLLLGTIALDRSLAPGDFADPTGDFALPLGVGARITVVADDDGQGTGRERECDEANNLATLDYDPTVLGLWLTLDDGTTAVGAGDEVTYRVRVANSFPGTASGVAVVDPLPAELQFVGASDGGVLSLGRVEWPPFSLAAGGIVERTVTVKVDPALSLTTRSIANSVSVTDDGAQGVDATPANNVAVDVDAVVTATADAGGPYLANEGSAVLLDGSASFDRDGALVAFEWDLDDDGAFDDATGAQFSRPYLDEGVYPVRLRVRDDAGEVDVASTTVTVANVAPAVAAPTSLAGDEGGAIGLAGVAIADPGALDALTATVSWGDGAGTSAAVPGGAPALSHIYLDNGTYPLSLCVDDGDGGRTCAAIEVSIANVAPEVRQTTTFDALGWTGEELPGATTVRWSVDGAGALARELANGRPSFLVGDVPSYGSYEFSLRVSSSSDDDYIGFGLGYRPGDLANASANYLMVDWKRGDQSGARRGLALSRVFGNPVEAEFWLHADQDANGSAKRVQELQRGRTRGSQGWSPFATYLFRVESLPTRVRVWVDGTLELDVPGSFPSGRLAFYNYSQAETLYTPIGTRLFVGGLEGSTAALRARFGDPGALDTHTAQVEWGDGATGPAAVEEAAGSGDASAAHVYADDGGRQVELCVVDDDGGEGCATIPGFIENVAPTVNLQVATNGFVDGPVALTGTTFSDPGLLDLHVVTVDWGDGTQAAATVIESNGSGSVAASHLYAAPGSYALRLCVDDGDGGVSCANRTVVVVQRVLDVALTKSAPVKEVRPNQLFAFTLKVENRGSLPATGIVLRDPIPANLLFDSATGGGVLSAGAVTWNLASLAAGASTQVTLTVRAAASLPFGGSTLNTASVSDDGASGADALPANNQSSWTVRFSDGVTPIVALPDSVAGVEGTPLTVAGTFADTLSESHTATISWGDGAVTNATVSPANGATGNVTGSHAYAENGAYPVSVCVRDVGAHVGCSSLTANVANSAPVVVEPGNLDLRGWRVEHYEGSQGFANWSVATDGLSVTQTLNSRASVFASPLSSFESTLQGTARVLTLADDDFFGFVLGFHTNDSSNPAADFLLIDWKEIDQTSALKGLALSRVRGVPNFDELWGHSNLPVNGTSNGLVPLARALTRGSTGWVTNVDYRFKFEYTATRLKVWVNDTLEFDVAGSFPAGNFGFYNHSQEQVRYSGFITGLAAQNEGETFSLVAPYTDKGTVDAHTATIDWDDGESGPAPAASNGGQGAVSAAHDYFDNGAYSIETCVTDDDGGSDCGRFPLQVFNVAPTLIAGPDTSTSAGLARAFDLGSFTDPGRLDSHSATVEWGDGSAVEEAQVVSDDGAGTVSGQHAFATAGTRTVKVCVKDDDGGQGCDTLQVTVGVQLPVLTAVKTVSAIDRDGDGQVTPGDDLLYTIEVRNVGGSAATGLRITDPTPAHTTLQPASVTPELLVTSFDPLTIELPRLDAGFGITVQFVASIDGALPSDVREIVNSGTATSVQFGPIPTDDPSQPGAADPTRIAVSTQIGLALTKSATLVDLDGNGVTTEGDEIAWSISASNVGDTEASGVLLRDPLPSTGTLVSDSVVASTGAVTRLDPIEVIVDRLGAGESATLEFRTRLPAIVDRGTTAISNQAEVIVAGGAPMVSDDPATPSASDPTTVAVVPIPVLTVQAPSAAEGDAGPTRLRFRLVLDVPTSIPTSVGWSTADGTASAGADYSPASGVAIFAPGATETFVDVDASGDTLVEADESVRLLLASPVDLRLATDEAAGTIINDDATSIAIAPVETEEGDALGFVARLSAPSAFEVAVDWATADGTALAGEDYVAATGRLVFAPLETEVPLPVATVEDALLEEDESVELRFSNAVGASLASASALGTILDDDMPVLAVTKSVQLVDDVNGDGRVDRGERLHVRIRVESAGRGIVRGARLVDPLPAGLALLPGSLSTSDGEILAGRRVDLLLRDLAPEEAVDVDFDTIVDPAVGPQAVVLANQAVVSAAGLDFPSDDPSTPEPLDPTVVEIRAVPRLVATKTAALAVDADGDGLATGGDVLEYRIVVTNVGGAATTAVELRDPIPSSTSIVPGSLVVDRGTAVAESPVLVAVGSLGAGESATIRFRTKIDAALPAELRAISNQGLVECAELPAVPTDDPAVGGDADATVTMIGAAPRLVVEKRDALAVDVESDGSASAGDTIGYSLAVRNFGSAPAITVVVEDPIAPEVTLEPGSITTTAGQVVSETPLRVEIAELPAGASAEIRFRVRVNEPLGTGVESIANQAIVTAVNSAEVRSDDPEVDGAADPTVTLVVSEPRVVVEKRDFLAEDGARDGVASPGDALLYRIVARNRGDVPATSILLEDLLAPELTIVPGSLRTDLGAVLGEAPAQVRWGYLLPRGSAVLSFRARVAAPFPIDRLGVANQAMLASAEISPVASDDPDTASPDDPTATEVFIRPSLSVADGSAPESGGSLGFLLTLSEPSNRPVRVQVSSVDGTAFAPADFAVVSTEIEIPAGETEALVTVPLVDDSLFEGNETMQLRLASPEGATLADGTATGTIVEDDPPPMISIGDASIVEEDEGTTDLLFPVTLSAPGGLPVQVRYTTVAGTAAAGADFEPFSGILSLPAGTVVSSIRIEILGDRSDELDEVFSVDLSSPTNATIGDGDAVGTILDDDLAQLSIGDVTLLEGDSGIRTAQFAITLAEPAAAAVSFDYATIQETATEGLDYLAASGTITLPAESSAATLTVQVVGDSWFEEDERFLVRLSNPVEAALVDGEGVGTIRNDEGCASANLVVNGGAETLAIDGSLASWTPVAGLWSARFGFPFAAVERGYFDGAQDPLSELVQSVSLTLFDKQLKSGLGSLLATAWVRQSPTGGAASVQVDSYDASNELLASTSIGAASSASAWEPLEVLFPAPAGTVRAVFRLQGDGYFDGVALRVLDAPTLSISDAAAYEPDSGTTPLPFLVSLSCPIEPTMRLNVATANGSATGGSDYQALAQQVSIPRGAVSTPVPVTVLGDLLAEGPESLFLNATGTPSVSWVTLVDGSGLGTIRDGDVCQVSSGYWKNHPELWPSQFLVAGGVLYDAAAISTQLGYQGTDPSTRILKQLLAALLNLQRGSDPLILPTVQAADDFLVLHPLGSVLVGADKTTADDLELALEKYNAKCTKK